MSSVVLLTLLLACCALLGALAVLYLLPTGLAEVVAAARPSLAREGFRPRVIAGLLKTAASLCLVALPFAATPIAESLNDWVDPDGDGMLADMENGSYDWVDINGGDFFRIWGLGSAITLAALLVLLRAVRSDASEVRESLAESG